MIFKQKKACNNIAIRDLNLCLPQLIVEAWFLRVKKALPEDLRSQCLYGLGFWLLYVGGWWWWWWRWWLRWWWWCSGDGDVVLLVMVLLVLLLFVVVIVRRIQACLFLQRSWGPQNYQEDLASRAGLILELLAIWWKSGSLAFWVFNWSFVESTPHQVAVANEGLKGSPTKNVMIPGGDWHPWWGGVDPNMSSRSFNARTQTSSTKTAA